MQGDTKKYNARYKEIQQDKNKEIQGKVKGNTTRYIQENKKQDTWKYSQQDKNKEIQGKIQGNTTQDTRKYTAKYKKIKSEVQGNTRQDTRKYKKMKTRK